MRHWAFSSTRMATLLNLQYVPPSTASARYAHKYAVYSCSRVVSISILVTTLTICSPAAINVGLF